MFAHERPHTAETSGPAGLASLSFSFPRPSLPSAPETAPACPRSDDPYLANFIGLRGNIAVYGGSFDPIHLDHVKVALAVQSLLGPDGSVIFLPNKRNPDKPNPANVSSADRMEMIRLALLDHPGLYVSDFEMNSSIPQPMTYDTMKTAKEQAEPSANLLLVLGTDILNRPQYFTDIHERLPTFRPLFVARHTFDQAKIDALSEILPPEAMAVIRANLMSAGDLRLSSTLVRQELAGGLLPADKLSTRVLEYIVSKGLYGLPASQN